MKPENNKTVVVVDGRNKEHVFENVNSFKASGAGVSIMREREPHHGEACGYMLPQECIAVFTDYKNVKYKEKP